MRRTSSSTVRSNRRSSSWGASIGTSGPPLEEIDRIDSVVEAVGSADDVVDVNQHDVRAVIARRDFDALEIDARLPVDERLANRFLDPRPCGVAVGFEHEVAKAGAEFRE